MTTSQTRPRSPFLGGGRHYQADLMRRASEIRNQSGHADFDMLRGGLIIAPVTVDKTAGIVEFVVFPEGALSLAQDAQAPRENLEENLSIHGLSYTQEQDGDALRIRLSRSQVEVVLQGMVAESTAFESLIHTAARSLMSLREIHTAIMKGVPAGRRELKQGA